MSLVRATTQANEIEEPSWEEVEALIRALDGSNCDVVELVYGPDDIPWMTIAGPKGQQYWLWVTSDSGADFLVDPAKGDGEVVVTFPYQTEQPCPERQLVLLDSVLVAAREFWLHGKASQRLQWEHVD